MALQQWADAAIPVARSMTVGSRYSQDYRMGKNSYDCSSFQNRLFQHLGLPNVNPRATTVDMSPSSNYMRRLGFTYVKGTEGAQPGDVFWRKGHTEMYTGGNNTIGAHSSTSGVSEYSKQGTKNWSGYWRYTGDRFLGGGTGQGNSQPNPEQIAAAQAQASGMADPAVQQAVVQSQGVQPTVVLQMPQEEPRGFSGWSSAPAVNYSGLVDQGNAQAMQMAQSIGQGLRLGKRSLA